MFSIKKIEPADIDTLLRLSRETFHSTYFHLTDPLEFDTYFSAAFTHEKLLSELNNPNSDFYFALVDDEPVGYLKLNIGPSKIEPGDESGMEMERIYLLNEYQGKQFGKQLLQFAIQYAIDKKLKYIWLCVWDKNPTAIRFYESYGFNVFGRYSFPFGKEKHEDLLMKLELNP